MSLPGAKLAFSAPNRPDVHKSPGQRGKDGHPGKDGEHGVNAPQGKS